MARVKRGVIARARHKKILKQAKGYYGARSRVYRVAFQAVIKAGQYAYRDRRQRKRQFRQLWIARINAAARQNGISYSKFINGLKSELKDNRVDFKQIQLSSEIAPERIIAAMDTLRENILFRLPDVVRH